MPTGDFPQQYFDGERLRSVEGKRGPSSPPRPSPRPSPQSPQSPQPPRDAASDAPRSNNADPTLASDVERIRRAFDWSDKERPDTAFVKYHPEDEHTPSLRENLNPNSSAFETPIPPGRSRTHVDLGGVAPVDCFGNNDHYFYGNSWCVRCNIDAKTWLKQSRPSCDFILHNGAAARFVAKRDAGNNTPSQLPTTEVYLKQLREEENLSPESRRNRDVVMGKWLDHMKRQFHDDRLLRNRPSYYDADNPGLKAAGPGNLKQTASAEALARAFAQPLAAEKTIRGQVLLRDDV